jgi:hypothetical protein
MVDVYIHQGFIKSSCMVNMERPELCRKYGETGCRMDKQDGGDNLECDSIWIEAGYKNIRYSRN